jgi:hypothetical protein
MHYCVYCCTAGIRTRFEVLAVVNVKYAVFRIVIYGFVDGCRYV